MSVGGANLELAFLGCPAGLARGDVEGWLTELIGVADEVTSDPSTTRSVIGPAALPARLHHALTGFLFYEAELWGDPAGRQPCALALLEADGKVAFGWVGSGRLDLRLDGRPFEPVWIIVRDDAGREARAFVADARLRVGVRATWPSGRGGAEGEQAWLEAAWPGQAAPIPPPRETSEPSPVAGEQGGSAEAAAGAEALQPESAPAQHRPPARFWRFRSWMDKLAGDRARAEGPPVTIPSTEPIAHDVPGVPDLIEGSEPTEQAAAEPEVAGDAARAKASAAGEAPPVESARRAEAPGEDALRAAPPLAQGIAPAEGGPRVSLEPEPATLPATAEAGQEPAPPRAARMAPAQSREAVPSTVDPFDLGLESDWEPTVSAERAVGAEPVRKPELPEPVADAEPAREPQSALAKVLELVADAELAREPELLKVPEPVSGAEPAREPQSAPAPVPADVIEPQSAPAPVPEDVIERESAPAPMAEPVVEQEPAAASVPARVVEPITESEPRAEAPAGSALEGELSGSPAEATEAEAEGEERVAASSSPRVVRRPAWPEPDDDERTRRRVRWRRTSLVGAFILLLFAAGWGLGRLDLSRLGRQVSSTLVALGLGPARYELAVTSRPSGAWIKVDGVDQAVRTPATLELKPGTHEIVLSLSGEGGSSHTVRGKRGERVGLDAELWGSLQITVPEGSVPIAVMVDGMPRGYAPLAADRLPPGIHRLQFSGPGVAPWEQTVEVHVNRTAEVVARPVESPPTGVLEVRATMSDEAGAEGLAGATIWIDGQPRGATPLRLELPRGPHSVRVRYHADEAPVQVIDLPGGNERFVTAEFGLSADFPRLESSLPARVPLDRPTVLSATLDHARAGDVREMWLHGRTPEGAWRRYPMSVMKATGGVVGVVVFPTVLFDANGRTAWYVSASTPTGDEYFTEIQPAQAATAP